MFFPERSLISACGTGCQLNRDTKHPKLNVKGQGKAGILIVAPFPDVRESLTKQDARGPIWDHLDGVFHAEGLDLIKDCWTAYAVRCHAPEGVNAEQVKACFPYIWQEVERLKPKVIILLGIEAATAWIMPRWLEGLDGIEKWRGWAIPDRKAQAWVVPTLNPIDVTAENAYPSEATILVRDIKMAIKVAKQPLPAFCERQDDKSLVTVLTDTKEILAQLNHLLLTSPDGTLVSFDYETTGKKPYKKGHDIVTCAYSADLRNAYAFPFHNVVVRDKWKEVLRSKKLRKTAHQFKFEELWSGVILDMPVVGWRICTCLAAHIEDNRSGVSGLKFQAAVRFGIYDYSKSIEKFLKSSDKDESKYGANAFNRIKEAPLRKLLLYNGLDALYGKWLAEEQVRHMV